MSEFLYNICYFQNFFPKSLIRANALFELTLNSFDPSLQLLNHIIILGYFHGYYEWILALASLEPPNLDNLPHGATGGTDWYFFRAVFFSYFFDTTKLLFFFFLDLGAQLGNESPWANHVADSIPLKVFILFMAIAFFIFNFLALLHFLNRAPQILFVVEIFIFGGTELLQDHLDILVMVHTKLGCFCVVQLPLLHQQLLFLVDVVVTNFNFLNLRSWI